MHFDAYIDTGIRIRPQSNCADIGNGIWSWSAINLGILPFRWSCSIFWIEFSDFHISCSSQKILCLYFCYKICSCVRPILHAASNIRASGFCNVYPFIVYTLKKQILIIIIFQSVRYNCMKYGCCLPQVGEIFTGSFAFQSRCISKNIARKFPS